MSTLLGPITVYFMLSDILQSPFYVVRYITESILCCQIYHRVHFMLSDIITESILCCQIYHRVHFMLSDISESILCCQIYHRVHFMLSTKHTTDNTVLKHHFHRRHSFEAPFPLTTQFQSTISTDDRLYITQVWLTTSFWHNNSSMTMIFIVAVTLILPMSRHF